MKRFPVKSMVSMVFLLGFVYANLALADSDTTVENILGNRDLYDGKEVSVPGTVSNLKFKTSKAGNAYTTFSVVEKSRHSINVYVRKHPKLRNGEKVKVTGTYRKVKRVGRYTFYNEIEATEILGENGHP
jgi:hypothetical protein